MNNQQRIAEENRTRARRVAARRLTAQCDRCRHPRSEHGRLVLSSVESYQAACLHDDCVCSEFTRQ